MFSKGNVLVVDDEINLCRILGAKLAKNGFSVVAVHDGQQAIDKVRETAFDVVLLDLMLPKVDGLSALAEIRSLDSELPIIVMTACESSEAVETANHHGISAYVNKPFDLDNLVQLVQTTSAGAVKRAGRQSSDSSVLFAKNQPIVFEVLNGRTSGAYQSRVESKDDRTLSVLAPSQNGCILHLDPRTPVRIGIAAKDAYYSFNSYVLDLRVAETPVVVIDKPRVIYRCQRRKHERFPFDVDVRYGRAEDDKTVPNVLAEGRTCDLSAGGIEILAKEQLQPGDLVYLKTGSTSEAGPINAVAEVLRSRKSDSGDHIVAMRFKRLNDKPAD